MKIKSARETCFLPFFRFFPRVQNHYHGHFFQIFTPSPDFSRGLFGMFSRVWFKISRKTKIFYRRDIFFTGRISEKKSKKRKITILIRKIQKACAKKGTLKKKSGFFHGYNFWNISRAKILVSRVEICSKFSRGHLLFHGHFLRFFHGEFLFFTRR